MMLSVEMGLYTQNSAQSQAPSSPLGPTQQDEEKKKQSHIPTVEVSTAQLQAVSARVGDFLANQPSRSTNVSGSSSGNVLPTGADGALPAAAPVGETQPAAPTEDGGTSTDGEPDEGAIARSLLAEERAPEVGREAPVSPASNEYDSLSTSEDDDDLTYSPTIGTPPLSDLPPASPIVVGTVVDILPRPEAEDVVQDELSGFDEEKDRQDGEQSEVESQGEAKKAADNASTSVSAATVTQVSNGGFSLLFDEAGTYQFAAAS